MKIQTIFIPREISFDSLEELKRDNAITLYERYEFIIDKCLGGDIEATDELIQYIQSISYSAKVNIIIRNYAISSAVYLYFKLLFEENKFKGLRVTRPEDGILFVFHRPRKNLSIRGCEYVKTSSSCDDLDLIEVDTKFEDFFYQLIKFLEKEKCINSSYGDSCLKLANVDKWICAYNRGYDFTFIYP